MSDYLDNPDEFGGGSRRRAVWALVVLACIALIVGCLMVLFGGGSGKQDTNANPNVPVNTNLATVSTATAHSPQSTAPTTGDSSASSSPSHSSAAAGKPCTAAGPCGGDGGVLAQVNAYRVEHGQSAVTGSVTANAQTCALHKGSGPTCVPHYIWTVATAQDGKQAVGKLSGFGSHWLLDPKMSSIGVGWAYVAGSYQCVILKTLTTD